MPDLLTTDKAQEFGTTIVSQKLPKDEKAVVKEGSLVTAQSTVGEHEDDPTEDQEDSFSDDEDGEDDPDLAEDSVVEERTFEEIVVKQKACDRLLKDISEQLVHYGTKDIFAIGGSTPITKESPVVVRWGGTLSEANGAMCELPVDDKEDREEAFTRLRNACQPATFGLGSKDVLDEEYRKASKMDADDFCTNLNLSQSSIIQTIEQTLCQRVKTKQSMHGVTAEMYKLNIYSSPLGKFKKHVDTPRSSAQMGSLVVCLPHEHKGGALIVRHGGQEIKFDWSKKSKDIQWAAFYSDCEHEIQEVTSGHRITLTYNLYWTQHGGARMAEELRAFSHENLPFYAQMKELVENMMSLPRGRLIGFKCTHGYPHTSHVAIKNRIAPTLKGLDMVVFQVLDRLVGNARVAAVFDPKKVNWYDGGENQSVISVDEQKVLVFQGGWEEGCNPADLKAFERRKVTWLNGSPRKFDELQIATVAYGNGIGDLETFYTAAAIVAKIDGRDDEFGYSSDEELY